MFYTDEEAVIAGAEVIGEYRFLAPGEKLQSGRAVYISGEVMLLDLQKRRGILFGNATVEPDQYIVDKRLTPNQVWIYKTTILPDSGNTTAGIACDVTILMVKIGEPCTRRKKR